MLACSILSDLLPFLQQRRVKRFQGVPSMNKGIDVGGSIKGQSDFLNLQIVKKSGTSVPRRGQEQTCPQEKL